MITTVIPPPSPTKQAMQESKQASDLLTQVQETLFGYGIRSALPEEGRPQTSLSVAGIVIVWARHKQGPGTPVRSVCIAREGTNRKVTIPLAIAGRTDEVERQTIARAVLAAMIRVAKNNA